MQQADYCLRHSPYRRVDADSHKLVAARLGVGQCLGSLAPVTKPGPDFRPRFVRLLSDRPYGTNTPCSTKVELSGVPTSPSLPPSVTLTAPTWMFIR